MSFPWQGATASLVYVVAVAVGVAAVAAVAVAFAVVCFAWLSVVAC